MPSYKIFLVSWNWLLSVACVQYFHKRREGDPTWSSCLVKHTCRHRLVRPWSLKILFPLAKHDFHNSMPLNAFASKAATNTVIAGLSSKDLEFFIERIRRASISSFSALRKSINVFLFFPRENGREGLTSGLAYSLASAKTGLECNSTTQPTVLVQLTHKRMSYYMNS